MLSIVIVNYNTSHLVKECVNSINKYPPRGEYEIIVVDNNSQKEDRENLNGQDFNVIFSSENEGFSKANNKGAKIAKGEYILFLNPDTVVKENCLKDTLEFLENHSDAGIVGCRVRLEDGTLDFACKRNLPTIKNSIGHYLKLNGKIKSLSGYRRLDLPDDYIGEIECVVGAFMMMPKKLFDEAGGFCEDYFMYAEDVELCYQVIRKGFKVYYFGKGEIIHKKRASSRKSKRAKKAFYESMKIYYNKHKKNSRLDFLVYMAIDAAKFLGL